jgi:hypothetical protein
MGASCQLAPIPAPITDSALRRASAFQRDSPSRVARGTRAGEPPCSELRVGGSSLQRVLLTACSYQRVVLFPR